MGSVGKDKTAVQDFELFVAQAGFLDVQAGHTPEIWESVMLDRNDLRSEELVVQLKMLRLKEQALMPKKWSLDLHYFLLPLSVIS